MTGRTLNYKQRRGCPRNVVEISPKILPQTLMKPNNKLLIFYYYFKL